MEHGNCNCECSSIVGGPIRPPTKSKSAGPILERRVSQRCARHVQCQRDYRQLPSRQATCLLGGDLQHILLCKAFIFKYNSRSMHTMHNAAHVTSPALLLRTLPCSSKQLLQYPLHPQQLHSYHGQLTPVT